MTPTELNAIEAEATVCLDVSDLSGDSDTIILNKNKFRQLIAALRSQTLSFHGASEMPRNMETFLAIKEDGIKSPVWLTGREPYPWDKSVKDSDILGFLYESDLLAAFTQWQSTQGGKHE